MVPLLPLACLLLDFSITSWSPVSVTASPTGPLPTTPTQPWDSFHVSFLVNITTQHSSHSQSFRYNGCVWPCPHSLSTLLIESHSPNCNQSSLTQLDWLACSKDALSLCLPKITARMRMPCLPGIYGGLGDPNSGPDDFWQVLYPLSNLPSCLAY